MDGKEKYEVYGWGANSYGQLGLGSLDDHLLPQKIPPFLEEDENPLIFTGGGGHTALLTDTGALYVCGWNTNGQLGNNSRENLKLFQKLGGISNIRHVACGWNHTLIVTDDGKCYSFGSNAFDQLACGKSKMQLQPFLIQGIQRNVIMVAAGMRHSVALTEDGCVYTWGCGKKGQLGLAEESLVRSPVPAPVFFGENVFIKDIKAGAEFTAALSADGDVYCWGSNLHGQCGLPGQRTNNNSDFEIVNRVYQPRKMSFPNNEKILKIHLGWSHVVAMTECKKILTWGRDDYGQLGDGHCKSRYEPKELTLLTGTVESMCGGSEHNLAITGDSRLLTWGWNEHGMCATGNEDNIPTPYSIPIFHGKTLVMAGCGAGTSFLCIQNKH